MNSQLSKQREGETLGKNYASSRMSAGKSAHFSISLLMSHFHLTPAPTTPP